MIYYPHTMDCISQVLLWFISRQNITRPYTVQSETKRKLKSGKDRVSQYKMITELFQSSWCHINILSHAPTNNTFTCTRRATSFYRVTDWSIIAQGSTESNTDAGKTYCAELYCLNENSSSDWNSKLVIFFIHREYAYPQFLESGYRILNFRHYFARFGQQFVRIS